VAVSHLTKNYFEPPHKECAPRTPWSLQNALAESSEQSDPIPMYPATALPGEYFTAIQ